ncbi:MAG: DUF655 domain-containing protein [Patescibacteria group bacterium]
MKEDEKALVLDFLPRGKSTGFKQEPIAQVVGKDYFTLLEVVPRENISLKPGMEVYIGREERKEIDHIKKRIQLDDLTSTALSELENLLPVLVKENEKKFVEFFNFASPITIKRHQLELLPGLGKKHMLEVLAEREKKPFESFAEIEQRVRLLPNVQKTIVKRILEELSGEEEKHFLFAKPFAREKPGSERRDFGRRRF